MVLALSSCFDQPPRPGPFPLGGRGILADKILRILPGYKQKRPVGVYGALVGFNNRNSC